MKMANSVNLFTSNGESGVHIICEILYCCIMLDFLPQISDTRMHTYVNLSQFELSAYAQEYNTQLCKFPISIKAVLPQPPNRINQNRAFVLRVLMVISLYFVFSCTRRFGLPK